VTSRSEINYGWGPEVTDISARVKYLLVSVFFITFTVASCLAVIKYSHEIVELENYGYLGIFLVAFIAGSSIPTPISYLLLTFTFGGVLNPALVGLSAGIGAGIGGTLVYFLGREGRRFLPRVEHFSMDAATSHHLAARFLSLAERRGSIVVFLMSAMLNPVFAPMAIAMGALRFRLAKFFAMCVAGSTVKSLIIAYAGFLGVGTLLRIFG
jgi:membrane protein YqaA with SNARE-associated domain